MNHLLGDEWLKRVSEISGSYIKTEEIKNLRNFLQFPHRSNNNLKVKIVW